jgi:hypothetical protein
MRYEDALKAVRTSLVQNGFGIEGCHDGMAKAGSKTIDALGNCQEFTIFETEQIGGQTATVSSGYLLPRVVVCASHGGFAEVFLRQSNDEADLSVWDSSIRLADATAIRLARAMLDAGKSAFLPREIEPNGSDSSDLLGHRT